MFHGQSDYSSPGSSRRPKLYASMGKGAPGGTATTYKTGTEADSGGGALGAIGEGFEQVFREIPTVALTHFITGGSEQPSGEPPPEFTFREGPVDPRPSGPSTLLILGLLGAGGVAVYLIATR